MNRHDRVRWSKKTDQLVLYVARRCRPGLQSELAHWIEESPRFSAFITTNQDKVRKKLNTADEEDAVLSARKWPRTPSRVLSIQDYRDWRVSLFAVP